MLKSNRRDLVRRKSSFSDNVCVEVAPVDGNVAVRDSKNPADGFLVYTPEEWRAFVAGVKNGEFDSVV